MRVADRPLKRPTRRNTRATQSTVGNNIQLQYSYTCELIILFIYYIMTFCIVYFLLILPLVLYLTVYLIITLF